MTLQKAFFAACFAVAAGAAGAGTASAACGGQVKFAAGSNSGVVSGKVSGYDTCDYSLTAQKGQTLSAKLTKGSGLDVIMLDPVEHDFANGALKLPQSGRYTVRVLQTRNDARKGKVRDFSLTLGVKGAGSAAAAGAPAMAAPGKQVKVAQASSDLCEGSGAFSDGTANMSGKLAGGVCNYNFTAKAGQSVTLLLDAKPGVEAYLAGPSGDAMPIAPDQAQPISTSGTHTLTIGRTRNDVRKGGSKDFSAVLNIQ